MITFTEVSANFRSLVERRRKHFSFLFSTAVAFSILADGLLHGRLPKALASDSSELLLDGAMALMFLSIVTALREARLHRGLVYNGYLFAALSDAIGASIWDSQDRPRKLSLAAVSTSLFTIALVSGLSLLVFNATALGVAWWITLLAFLSIAILTAGYFWKQHQVGATMGKAKLQAEPLAAGDLPAWRGHVIASVDDAHRDMLELLGLCGLVWFFGFQLLAGAGNASVQLIGNLAYSQFEKSVAYCLPIYMTVVTALALASYVRLRFAVGMFARALDPSDRPFRALSLDDSFYGLMILVALLSFDLIMLLAAALPRLGASQRTAFVAVVALIVLLGERIAMESRGRRLARSAVNRT